VVGLALVGAAIGGIACLRLAAVVSATPSVTWLPELNALVRPRLAVGERTRARAALVDRFIADPTLMLALFPGCGAGAASPSAGDGAAAPRCLDVIEATLQEAPWSGELWYAKALYLARAGEGEAPLFEALRMSWRTAPKEGWVAGGRVLLALRLYPTLPEDLRARASEDLALILEYDQYSDPLVTSYAADQSLRTTAQPALEKLSPLQLKKFIDIVRWKTHRG
jgi:hypothetical protein